MSSEKSELLNKRPKKSTDRRYGTYTYQPIERDYIEEDRIKTARCHKYAVALVIVVVVVGIALGLVLGLPPLQAKWQLIRVEPPDVTQPLPPSASPLLQFSRAAVAVDSPRCADVASSILAQNGSAVDAAVSALLCLGVVHPQSSGLGGGFVMTVYQKNTRNVTVLDARGVAPGAATEDMFQKQSENQNQGPLSVAVPGELLGLLEAHRRFGKLPWNNIVQPAASLAASGVPVSATLAKVLKDYENIIRQDDELRMTFVNSSTNNVLVEGNILTQSRLAATLLAISNINGTTEYYNGRFASDLADDLTQLGGIITANDIANYSAQWRDSTEFPLHISAHNEDVRVHSAPLPSSGPLLSAILRLLDQYSFNSSNISGDTAERVTVYHRFIEACKHAFGTRGSLGDPAFVNMTEIEAALLSEYHANNTRMRVDDLQTVVDPAYYGAIHLTPRDNGTSHVVIITPEGDAVAVSSTLNSKFGAGIVSNRTGIIYNNEMAAFSLPNATSNSASFPSSPANFIAPGKRPLSSMCPSIVLDSNGNVRYVIGGSGGPKTITATAYVLMRALWFGEDVKKAVDAPRLHHQLFPNDLLYEYGILAQEIAGLRRRGHHAVRDIGDPSVISLISRSADGQISVNTDFRKHGSAAGIN